MQTRGLAGRNRGWRHETYQSMYFTKPTQANLIYVSMNCDTHTHTTHQIHKQTTIAKRLNNTVSTHHKARRSMRHHSTYSQCHKPIHAIHSSEQKQLNYRTDSTSPCIRATFTSVTQSALCETQSYKRKRADEKRNKQPDTDTVPRLCGHLICIRYMRCTVVRYGRDVIMPMLMHLNLHMLRHRRRRWWWWWCGCMWVMDVRITVRRRVARVYMIRRMRRRRRRRRVRKLCVVVCRRGERGRRRRFVVCVRIGKMGCMCHVVGNIQAERVCGDGWRLGDMCSGREEGHVVWGRCGMHVGGCEFRGLVCCIVGIVLREGVAFGLGGGRMSVFCQGCVRMVWAFGVFGRG